jgi:hypothetical protein
MKCRLLVQEDTLEQWEIDAGVWLDEDGNYNVGYRGEAEWEDNIDLLLDEEGTPAYCTGCQYWANGTCRGDKPDCQCVTAGRELNVKYALGRTDQ